MSTSHWTGFHPFGDGSTLVNEGCDLDEGWIHWLIANGDEGDPRKNHIHIKCHTGARGIHDAVVCAIKVDGMREVNRRLLIENVNRITGLNLSYR